MKYLATALAIVGILSLLVLAACRDSSTESDGRGASSESRGSGGEHSEGSESGESGGEHSEGSGSGEYGSESESDQPGNDGEESGAQYGLEETYNRVRAGARLIISYDADQQLLHGYGRKHHGGHS